MTGRPTTIQRRSAEVRRVLGNDVRTIRTDAGVTATQLAAAAGISRPHLWGIETGRSEATTAILVRIGESLGANVSVRLYPGTGPRIRDHLQAAIAEALLEDLDVRWKRFSEVPVYRPVRGVIDLVLHDPGARLILATEIQSEMRRLEQVIRWSHQKRDSLPSADLWGLASAIHAPTVGGLLLLRSTRATRLTVNDHAALLGATYPARATDAFASLTGVAPWPGSAILWAVVEGGRAELLDGPPRSVTFGR